MSTIFYTLLFASFYKSPWSNYYSSKCMCPFQFQHCVAFRMHVFRTFAISRERGWSTSKNDELVIRRRTGTQGKFIGRSFFCDAWDFHDPRIMEWGNKVRTIPSLPGHSRHSGEKKRARTQCLIVPCHDFTLKKYFQFESFRIKRETII